MTFSQLARFQMSADRYQQNRSNIRFQYPPGYNGIPAPGDKNPFAPPGLDITGMTEADFKIIPVSKEIEQKIRDLAFRELRDGYGMTGSNELGETIQSYYPQIPPEDRMHAAHTLQKIHHEEACRLVDFVQSKIPGWQIGVPFDTSILNEYKQGIDVHA